MRRISLTALHGGPARNLWTSISPKAAWLWSKGVCRSVTGRIKKATSAEVIVNSIYFGDSKKDGDSASGSYRPAGAPVDVSASDFSDIEDDGELPF